LRDLEVQVARVANAGVRPLVTEAYRCYTSGTARAAIVLTWTAACADLIDKIATLYQSGDRMSLTAWAHFYRWRSSAVPSSDSAIWTRSGAA
jgi:hypothetical protein